jgi:hypothetical protein
MTIILIIFCIWGASALLRAAKENKRRREEQARSEQIKRMQREYQRQRAEAAEWTRKQIEMEREQRRIAKEQERQRKEQEKQAAVLEKHEKRIALLENRVSKLARDIESQKQLVADYSAQLDYLLLQQSGTTPGSKEFTRWQDKIVAKSNQVRKAENKYYDMMEAKATAERELAS